MGREWVYRFVGPPPAASATRAQRLCWIRKFYRFTLVAIAVVVIFAIIGGQTFLWILAVFGVAWWIFGWTSITLKIRRERAADSSHTGA